MINVKYLGRKFTVEVNGVIISLTPDEFHELVYQSLRAQEKEILSMMKITEKQIENIGDLRRKWNI